MTALIVLVLLVAAASALAWNLRPHTLIALDTSGSSGWGRDGAPVSVDEIAGRIPRRPWRRRTWVTFDMDVRPYTPGDKIRPNGGTNFDKLVSWVDAPETGDFAEVIVVTDGYAPEIAPAEPERWTWWLTTDTHTPDWLRKMNHEIITAA